MQATLRKVSATLVGIFCVVAGTTTFGIAVTLTSVAILAVTWYARLHLTGGGRSWRGLLPLAAVTALALYLCTFFAFLVFRTFEFSLVPPDDPQHNFVIFSSRPAAQELARQAYYPLIKSIPGHCYYPTGEQMKLLSRDPFTGERQYLYW